MLYQTNDVEWVRSHLRRWSPAFEHLLAAWAGWTTEGELVYLADDREAPQSIVLHTWQRFILLGQLPAVPAAIASIRHHAIVQDPPWPEAEVRHAWERDGRPWISLELIGADSFQAAYDLGFELAPDDKEEAGAYFFWVTGQPRYAAQVKHLCRVTQGLELYDEMRQSVDYDETGEYTRKCLERGPSFVCEVDGAKVCWSCTHVNGCLGMIYTPPEHRQKGYGRSLAAFQLDYMLAHTGLAHCFVIATNTASLRMMTSLGVPHLLVPLVWRKLRWPSTSNPETKNQAP